MRFSSSFCLAVLVLLCGATPLMRAQSTGYWRYVRTETYTVPYSGAYPDTSVTGGEGALTVVMQEPSVTPVPTLGSTFTWTPPPATLVPGTKIDWLVTARVTRNVQGRNLGQSLDSGLYPYQTASNLAKFNPYSTLRPGAVATDATMPVGKLVTYNNALLPNPSKIPSGSSYMDPQGLMTWLVRVNSSQTYYWSYIYQWVPGESPTGNTATPSNTTATGATNLALGKPAEMSSVYSAGYEASQCNNGSKNDMCHSKSEANPWWQVDLQGSYSLGDIVVYNRPGTYGSRENTITALISSDGRNWQRIYSHNGSDFTVLHIPVNGLTARYVRVQLNATDYMNLTEVEVYSVQGRAERLPR